MALVHAAQILADMDADVIFHVVVGSDENANLVRSTIAQTPLKAELKTVETMSTPTTEVFDDPSTNCGKGERSFINTIGSAYAFDAEDIPPSFYDADIVLLGGRALVPYLHGQQQQVLKLAKAHSCITVVGTVYDFRNEKANSDGKWPLESVTAYPYIDVLLCDEQEALWLTGKDMVEDAAWSLIKFGVGAFIITRGALPMIVWSSESLIEAIPLSTLPVSAYMDDLMLKNPALRKDTTGCGDNFLGGILVSIAKQLEKDVLLSMVDICAWGASSGGYTCTYHGGTYLENRKGEKAANLVPVVQANDEAVGKNNEEALCSMGGGNIGRAFIAQVFTRSGYRILIIDISQALVDALNTHGSYSIKTVFDHNVNQMCIEDVSAVHA